ncbi:MAG: TonB-dependent siderophore receptor [Porticoccaceae bacterium]
MALHQPPHRPQVHPRCLVHSAVQPGSTPAFKSRLLSVAIGCALGLGGVTALLPGAALAADTSSNSQAEVSAREYQIAGGRLSDVLAQFAAASGVMLSFDPQMLAGLNSDGLQGRYSVREGFSHLLAGSGYELVSTGSGYSLRQVKSEGGAVMLGTVMISGKAIGSTTEGTGSYTTYSTSSATRLNLSIQETPQSVTVMTRQRMDDQRMQSLEDVLQAVPGISIRHTSGYGSATPSMVARGTTLNSFQIDGVPASVHLQNYMQSSAIYDRVEIVRGATGLMNSLGTPAATVNMVRKRPTDEPLIKISAEAGNWDRYGSGLDVSGSLTESGSVRGRVVADYKNQGNWTDNYQQDYYTLYGIGEIDLSDNTLLTLGLNHTTRDTEAPTSRTPLYYANGQRFRFKPSDNDNPSWYYYDSEINNVFASLERQFDAGWSGKAEISHTKYESTSLYAGNLRLDGPDEGALFSLPWRYKPTDKQTAFDAYVTGPFSLFGREHEIIGGVTLSDLRREAPSYSRSWSGASTYYIPDYFDFTNTLPKPDQIFEIGTTDTDETQYSAYMSLRFHLSDATSLLLGGRVTDWKQNTESTTYATGIRTKSELKETGLFVPYAGIVHALNDTWSLYASYTEIFNPHPNRYRDINDLPLAPEEGLSYEVGVKASFYEGRLNTSLSLYKTDLDKRAIWYTADGRTVYDTADGTETQGVELEINGELAEGWQLGAGYSYNDIRDQNDDRLMTYDPQHILKVFSTYRLPGALNKLTVGGGFDWMSKRKAQDLEMGSYALASLMARYDINNNLSASANINNLFDKEYFASFDRGIYANGLYGPPRNFMVSLQYTY